MADFDKNRIAKMQQYLTDVTDPEFKGAPPTEMSPWPNYQLLSFRLES